MNTLSLVIQREYLTRVRKKSFIILTLLMPFLMVAMSLLPLWLSTINDKGVKNIAVIDNTGIYAPLLKSTDRFIFQIIDLPDKSKAEDELGKDLFAILQITDDLNKRPKAASLLSERQAPIELLSLIERYLEEKVTQQKLDELTENSNVDTEAVEKVRTILNEGGTVTLKTMRMSSDGNVAESSTVMASIIGMVFTILIYMFILMYGSMVMQSVLEEKKSRIVEVMVSSIKPVKLLTGKIIGVGLVGITQLAVWGILAGVLFSIVSLFITIPDQSTALMAASGSGISNEEIAKAMESIMSVNWIEIGIYFLIFFIGGYILYASIFAMFASAVDSDEDVSQFTLPITLIIIFAFFAGIYSVENPDGPLAFWASLIPFSSPIVMMVRIPFGIPLWEKLLSVALLFGTFILISRFAAKIYRVGILMYGKKVTIKEMLKWAKYK